MQGTGYGYNYAIFALEEFKDANILRTEFKMTGNMMYLSFQDKARKILPQLLGEMNYAIIPILIFQQLMFSLHNFISFLN